MNSTEYLDITEFYHGWKYGLDLPESISSHRMVSLDNENELYPMKSELYIVGGYDSNRHRNEILELKCSGSTPDTCQFQETKVKLKYPRNSHIALAISESHANELCN